MYIAFHLLLDLQFGVKQFCNLGQNQNYGSRLCLIGSWMGSFCSGGRLNNLTNVRKLLCRIISVLFFIPGQINKKCTAREPAIITVVMMQGGIWIVSGKRLNNMDIKLLRIQ